MSLASIMSIRIHNGFKSCCVRPTGIFPHSKQLVCLCKLQAPPCAWRPQRFKQNLTDPAEPLQACQEACALELQVSEEPLYSCLKDCHWRGTSIMGSGRVIGNYTCVHSVQRILQCTKFLMISVWVFELAIASSLGL